jgi:DNA invertase Pin-like site-specific DNA recombinase
MSAKKRTWAATQSEPVKVELPEEAQEAARLFRSGMTVPGIAMCLARRPLTITRWLIQQGIEATVSSTTQVTKIKGKVARVSYVREIDRLSQRAIVEAYQSGLDMNKIAKLHSFSVAIVRNCLLESGVTLRTRAHPSNSPSVPVAQINQVAKLRRKGHRIQAIAKEYGVTVQTIYRWLRRHPDPPVRKPKKKS